MAEQSILLFYVLSSAYGSFSSTISSSSSTGDPARAHLRLCWTLTGSGEADDDDDNERDRGTELFGASSGVFVLESMMASVLATVLRRGFANQLFNNTVVSADQPPVAEV